MGELLATERTYLQALSTVIYDFKNPLQEVALALTGQPKRWSVTNDQLGIIFAHIEMLHAITESLLAKLGINIFLFIYFCFF